MSKIKGVPDAHKLKVVHNTFTKIPRQFHFRFLFTVIHSNPVKVYLHFHTAMHRYIDNGHQELHGIYTVSFLMMKKE